MVDADTSPDTIRDLELATHLNNLLRAYAEEGRREGRDRGLSSPLLDVSPAMRVVVVSRP